jgi:predicted transcriptional regulator
MVFCDSFLSPTGVKDISKMTELENQDSTFVELTAEIVCAYVGNNAVPAAEIPALIKQVHSALSEASAAANAPDTPAPEPAVPVNRSITPDHLICLEDGKKFRSLKRHLRTSYNMTRKSTARSGGCARTTRWSHPTMRPSARGWQRRSALARGAARAADLLRAPECNSSDRHCSNCSGGFSLRLVLCVDF